MVEEGELASSVMNGTKALWYRRKYVMNEAGLPQIAGAKVEK